MASWDLLDPEEEQGLHKTRLLQVEERPFKRITKRLTTVSNLVASSLTPKDSADASQPPQTTESSTNHDHLKEDITFDFAAFNSSIMRLQFLHDANARERERYAADQQRIVTECQDVRTNNVLLREQLESARATLAQRKKFDELAEKITANRLLRPREDQIASLAKLEEEIKELDRESQTYSITWGERRDQFNKIMDEGMLLRAQIRDEKEEVDRREGMDEGNESDAVATPRGQTPGRGLTPRPGTPKPEGENATPRIEVEEPRDGVAAATPAAGETGTPRLGAATEVGTPAAAGASRDVTPLPQTEEEKKDVEMSGNEADDTPRSGAENTGAAGAGVSGAEGAEDKMEVDN